MIECIGLDYAYQTKRRIIPIFTDFNLTIARGETVAITGASGSGKSTLLNLLAGLTQPNSGQVLFQGKNLAQMNENQRCLLRQQYFGFVYQFHYLLNNFSTLKNVMMPLMIKGTPPKEAQEKAQILLHQVGLSDRAGHTPSELSGGQRQRVALARALATKPECILADEPTGNLDGKNSQIVLDILLAEHQSKQTTLIIVTHNQSIAQQFKKQVVI